MNDQTPPPSYNFKTGDRIPARLVERRMRHITDGEILLKLLGDDEYLYLVGENNVLLYRVPHNPNGSRQLLYPLDELEEMVPPRVEDSTAVTDVSGLLQELQRRKQEISGLECGRTVPPALRESLLPLQVPGFIYAVDGKYIVTDENYIVLVNQAAAPPLPGVEEEAESVAPAYEAPQEWSEGDVLPSLGPEWERDGKQWKCRLGRFLYFCQRRGDGAFVIRDKLPISYSVEEMPDIQPTVPGAEAAPAPVPAELVFDLNIEGRMYAGQTVGDCFILYDESRREVLRHEGEEVFGGIHKDRILIFRHPQTGVSFGKDLHGNVYSSRKAQRVPPPPPPPAELSPEETVARMCRVMDNLLTRHEVNADFFRDTVLQADDKRFLVEALRGDLGLLSDDTQRARQGGKNMVLKGGLSLLKAGLLHLLYINSIRSQRGDDIPQERGRRMRGLVHDWILSRPDGTFSADVGQIPLHRLNHFFRGLSERADMLEKRDVLLRVHGQINLDEDYLAVQNEVLPISDAQAFLIYKYYRYTNIADRGDGLMMVHAVRMVMDFQGEGK